MNKHILDTDTLSEFIKGNKKVVNNVAKYIGEGQIAISVITYYEIMSGLLYKDAKKQLKGFEELMSISRIIPLSQSSAKIAANIEAELRKSGKVIGHTDTLIAGTALANNLQLITNNTIHFKRIKGLDLDNWVS